jgi:hypothetical protein
MLRQHDTQILSIEANSVCGVVTFSQASVIGVCQKDLADNVGNRSLAKNPPAKRHNLRARSSFLRLAAAGPDGHLGHGQWSPMHAGLASQLPLGPPKILAIYGQ